MTTQTQTQETVTQNTNTLFRDAEHYFTFRKNWASFINSEEAQPWKDERYGTKYQRVDGAYFLLYALLRGRKGTECFANEESFLEARSELRSAVNWKSSAAKYLAPYDGEVTMDMFKEAVSRCPDSYQGA